MAAMESVFGDDLGGVGKQITGAPIPNIGDTPDSAVAQDTPPATDDQGNPVSPYLAARRYGAAHGYGTGNPQ